MPMMSNPVTSLRRPTMNRNDLVGYVIDNDDSKHPDGRKLQRVKVRSPLLHRGIPDEDIPWSIQDTSNSVGNAGNGSVGDVNIPPIGSKVFYRVEENDPHNPRYSGSVATSDVTENNELLQDDYPHTRGFTDHAGNRWDMNAEKETVNFTHKSGATVHIDANGTVSVSAAQDVNIASQNNINIVAGGKVSITGEGGVMVDGQQIQLNGGNGNSVSPNTSRTRPAIPNVAGNTKY